MIRSALIPFSFGAATLLVTAPVWAQPKPDSPPTLVVRAEEPTGVFFDRDTITPQTPLLFTARLQNPSTEIRQIELKWRITDSGGAVRLNREAKFSLAPGAAITRRELFDAPARGGYLLEVAADARRKGPDVGARAALPFAVTIAPSSTTPGARPQSFFVLSTPALLTPPQLDFYNRLGARVLRSPLPADPTRPDWNAVEVQLGERVKRNLSTIALLPLGNSDGRGDSGRQSQAFWARQVPATLARYGSLQLWELSGDLTPADLDAWSQVARGRRSDITLLAPLPTLPTVSSRASLRLSALEGATFDWPTGLDAHPAALRRLWLSRALAAKSAGVQAFHLRRDEDNSQGVPGDAAGSLTSDYLSAIMAGASSMSESLAPPKRDATGARTMARGAAFSMLSRTLEDASFVSALFPGAPSLEGALFRAPRGSIAVVSAPQGRGTMTLRVASAQALDVFGNSLARDRDGQIEVPLSGQPTYVIAAVAPDVLSYALKNARVEGVNPLAAQILPLSRVPGTGGPGSAAIRVRLQNVGIGARGGQVKLNVPRGWKLARPSYDVRLNAGESRTYEFRAIQSASVKGATVPLGVEVSGVRGAKWKFDVPVASAQSASREAPPVVDAQLGEWGNAAWQRAARSSAGVEARVAYQWDARFLYVAAQVKEPSITPRRVDEAPYEFWRGHDALQIGFGFSNGPQTLPQNAPFRDVDRGFLLSPFGQSGPNRFDGRVLRLARPEMPVARIVDRTRWAGVAPGSSCAIARDENSETTIYEARIPWSALPELKPRALAEKDAAVRFGWLLHNDEGEALDWGRDVGNFPWWDNTESFVPSGRLTSPLRATLGFTLTGEVGSQGINPTTPLPTPVGKPQPRTIPTPRPAPRPTPIPTARPATLPAPVPNLPPAPPVVAPAPNPFVTSPPLAPRPVPPANDAPRPAPERPAPEPVEIPPFIIPPAGTPGAPRPLPPAAP